MIFDHKPQFDSVIRQIKGDQPIEQQPKKIQSKYKRIFNYILSWIW